MPRKAYLFGNLLWARPMGRIRAATLAEWPVRMRFTMRFTTLLTSNGNKKEPFCIP
jgi:hypothetical protein